MSAAFWDGLYLGLMIGAAMVALPVSLALRAPSQRRELRWKRAKWEKEGR